MGQASTREERLGLYLSVPFCRSKCTFCNFASGVYPASEIPRYVSRLIEDLRAARAGARQLGLHLPEEVDTIYLGGGTPSILTGAQLQTIFSGIREQFSLVPGAEITLEAAPSLLGDEVLAAAVEAGVNRISFGVQTFVDAEARAVGRLHTADDALGDLARARRAGIAAISVDLIAGLPGQTEASWGHSLAVLAEARPEHASVYMLEVDEDSRLGGEMLLGGIRYGAGLTPSDDAVADFYEEACRVLARHGLQQYEISNFARAGFASRHNLRYWERRPYLGIGLDAHSMLRGSETGGAVRFGTTDDLQQYLSGDLEDEAADGKLWGEPHWLDRREELEEAWFLGLRRNAGVVLGELVAKFGADMVRACEPVLEGLVDDGLVVFKREAGAARVALTDRGRMLSNEVFGRFLGLAVGVAEEQRKTAEIPAMAALSR